MYLISFCVYGCFCLLDYLCTMHVQCPWKDEDCWMLCNWSYGCCGPWCRCWVPNVDPLQEQKVPLTGESLSSVNMFLLDMWSLINILVIHQACCLFFKHQLCFHELPLGSLIATHSCASLHIFTTPTNFMNYWQGFILWWVLRLFSSIYLWWFHF